MRQIEELKKISKLLERIAIAIEDLKIQNITNNYTTPKQQLPHTQEVVDAFKVYCGSKLNTDSKTIDKNITL